MTIMQQRVARLLAAVLTVVAMGTWAAHRRLDRATTARASVAAQVEYQRLLAGVRLPLASLTQGFASSAWTVRRPAGHLLFVLSDTCKYSVKELPYWRALLDRAPAGTKVWIVSKHGEVLARELVMRASFKHVAAEAVRPADSWRFPVVTGLRGSPITVLLDGDMRATLVAWRMSPEAMSLFATQLERLDTVSFGGPFTR